MAQQTIQSTIQDTLIIEDTTVVTVDRLDTIHHDAAVAVRNGRIAAVGPSRDIVARFPGAERVDGAGKVVMPGFANIHTHFTLIIAKGIYEDLSPPHKPPFTSGLAPLPVPPLSNDEMNAMVRLAARCTGYDKIVRAVLVSMLRPNYVAVSPSRKVQPVTSECSLPDP